MLVKEAQKVKISDVEMLAEASSRGNRGAFNELVGLYQRRAGMGLSINTKEPSWLEQKIAVKMQDVTLQQALQNIVGTVDGSFSVSTRNNSVDVRGPKHPQKTAVPRKAQESAVTENGYVGKISIPMDDGKYFLEFMLRQSDLPEELKNFREEMIKEVLGKYVREAKLKKRMREALENAKTKAASKPDPKPQN